MSIAERLQLFKQNLAEEMLTCGRNQEAIQLLAVSKGQSLHAIREAYMTGQYDFGESYWQEARSKIKAMSDYAIRWHFIGAIQSNKSKYIASCFDWVHSVSSERIAQALNHGRSLELTPLNVLIQINLNDERKFGILPEDAELLAECILKLPRLRLRGLMVMSTPTHTESQKLAGFKYVTGLMQTLNARLNSRMDTLSMGMSSDWPIAIRAGSTMIRIGQAIFGGRV